MKCFFKILVILFMAIASFLPSEAKVTFNVVVIPIDLFKVCSNYYCYPEVSEIIASDVVENFNNTGRIYSPTMSYVRRAMTADENLRRYTLSIIQRYERDQSLDFAAMKIIAKSFNANSLLLISNDVPIDKAYARRSVWEMLVLSTNFDISYPYEMETNAILVDTVNDLVMWRGFYKKKISDSNDAFKAPNASDAYAKLEYFRLYSKDILSKIISQNIYLRFFPKLIDPQPIVKDTKPEGAYFRFESESNIPALQNKLIQHQRDKYTDRDEDAPDNTYGEMIYGD